MQQVRKSPQCKHYCPAFLFVVVALLLLLLLLFSVIFYFSLLITLVYFECRYGPNRLSLRTGTRLGLRQKGPKRNDEWRRAERSEQTERELRTKWNKLKIEIYIGVSLTKMWKMCLGSRLSRAVKTEGTNCADDVQVLSPDCPRRTRLRRSISPSIRTLRKSLATALWHNSEGLWESLALTRYLRLLQSNICSKYGQLLTEVKREQSRGVVLRRPPHPHNTRATNKAATSPVRTAQFVSFTAQDSLEPK